MLNFFSKILKYKKTLFIIGLSFIFAGILPIGVPMARAGDCDTSWYDAKNTCVCRNQKCEKVSYTSTEGWGDQCHKDSDCAGRADTGSGIIGKIADPLGAIGSAFMKVMVTISFAIPLFLFAFLSDLAGYLLQTVLNFILTASITQTPGVQLGWPIVRNLANMIIVLGFVVIGIATALRIESYEAKRLLPKLIIVAILVNFSLLFCGIVIDGTNILMNFMWTEVNKIKDVNGNVVGTMLFKNTSNSWEAITSIANTDSSWIAFAAAMMSNILYSMVAFFIYLLYAVILLCRIVFLMMLSVLSPLAFVCSVFPSTKSIWEMWKKNFIQWAIIGIPMGLFYYIAATTNNSMSHFLNTKDVITSTSLGGSGFSKELAGAISIMVPGLFLIGGFMLSLQITPMGAGAIMNFASKNKGKFVGGGLKSLAKGADAISGGRASKATQAISGGVQRTLNSMGLMGGSGAYAQKVEKEQKEVASKVDSMNDADIDKLAVSRPRTTVQRMEKLAAIQNRVTKGKISGLGSTTAEQSEVIDWAEGEQRRRKVFSDIRKNAVALNPNMAKTPDELFAAVQKVPPAKAAEWSADIMTPEVFNSLSQKQMTVIGEKGSQDLINRVRLYKHTAGVPASGQSKEWQAARAHMDRVNATLTPAEQYKNITKFQDRQNQLAGDANYA